MRANKRNSKIGIMIVGLTLMLFTFHVLSPAAALAASASEIDRDARAALANLYKNYRAQKLWATRRWRCWFSRASSRADSLSRGNSATALCAKAARPSPITGRWRRPMDSKPGFKRLATCCFSWTMPRSSISTTAAGFEAGGRAEPGRVGRRLRQEFVNHNPAKRCVCIHLRPEGTDGRHGYPGNEDYQN